MFRPSLRTFCAPAVSAGVTPLDQCTCDAAKGSKEVKGYIRSLLRQGLGAEGIIEKAYMILRASNIR